MSCNVTYDGEHLSPFETEPFYIKVAKGEVPGHSAIRKYGLCTTNATTGKRDMWQYGSSSWGDQNLTWTTDGTATIDSISSSSAADVGIPVVVEGLDINGLEVSQVAVLNGQTRVPLTTSLWRCNRAYNASTSVTTPVIGSGTAGQVYVYENTAISGGVPIDTTKIQTFFDNGNNQTLQVFWTVPADCTAYVVWSRVGLETKSAAFATLETWLRPYGMNFRLADSGSLATTGTSVASRTISLNTQLPGRTDIMARMDVSANSTTVSGRFDLLCVKNGY
jgi:hypothetical protein